MLAVSTGLKLVVAASGWIQEILRGAMGWSDGEERQPALGAQRTLLCVLDARVRPLCPPGAICCPQASTRP